MQSVSLENASALDIMEYAESVNLAMSKTICAQLRCTTIFSATSLWRKLPAGCVRKGCRYKEGSQPG
jgi:hypothetical protein